MIDKFLMLTTLLAVFCFATPVSNALAQESDVGSSCDSIRKTIASTEDVDWIRYWVSENYSESEVECFTQVQAEYDLGNCKYSSKADGYRGDQNDRIAQAIKEGIAAYGEPWAMHLTAMSYMNESHEAVHKKCRQMVDHSKARSWLTKSADAGDYDAMLLLGRLYASGYKGIFLPDFEKAAYWLKEGSERKKMWPWAEGQELRDLNSVGNIEDWHLAHRAFEEGADLADPYNRDLEEATKLYEYAASKGHISAMNRYAYTLEASDRDRDALEWYLKAANLGYRSGYCGAATVLYENQLYRDSYFLALASEASGADCEVYRDAAKDEVPRLDREYVEDRIEAMLPWDDEDSIVFN